MNTTAHASYAFLIYNLIYWIWFNAFPTGIICILVIFFGILPDFDKIFWVHVKKGKMDQNFQHHLFFWTHWPISYFPIIVIFFITLIFNFFPEFFLIPLVGIYSHMIFDSISCGDGLMWGKIPWKRCQYAKFINLFSNKTDGYHGNYWFVRYRKTIFFKIEIIAAIIVIIINIIYIIISYQLILYLVSLGVILFNLILGFRKIDTKFLEEPPEGRYNDYRNNSAYLEYSQKKNQIIQ